MKSIANAIRNCWISNTSFIWWLKPEQHVKVNDELQIKRPSGSGTIVAAL